jgi:hypothetical protein
MSLTTATRQPTQVVLAPGLTLGEYQRLCWYKLTYAAGAHLLDHGLLDTAAAATHLAFARYLRDTGRLDREFRPDQDAGDDVAAQ